MKYNLIWYWRPTPQKENFLSHHEDNCYNTLHSTNLKPNLLS